MADVERCDYITKVGVPCGGVLSAKLIARGHGRCHLHVTCKQRTVCKTEGCDGWTRSRYGHCSVHVKKAYSDIKREERRKGREALQREKQLMSDMRDLRHKLETPSEAAENEMYARIEAAKKVIAESLAREAS
jgi:hypothetical protein